MINRYEIRQRDDETFLFDIWDLAYGDKMFGSYTTRDRAEKFVNKLNAKADAQRLIGFEFVPYTGPLRSIETCLYRTPKARQIVNEDGTVKPRGKCHSCRVESGKVVVEYV